MIADMHCHIDLYPDYEDVAQEAAAQNIFVLAVTTTPKAWRGTKDRLNRFTNVHVALGLHPELAHVRADEITLFRGLLDESEFVGEVGLDGSPRFRQYARIQLKVFRAVLDACQRKGGRVLTIHSRRAAETVLECLKEHEHFGLAILHWFTGTKHELEVANRLGCWFSVGPAMLKSSSGLQRAALMPRERILLETDGPFGKVNDVSLRPAEVCDAIDSLAVLWSVSRPEVTDQLEGNQRELWRFAGLEGHP
jgi:TatD DNase family protein